MMYVCHHDFSGVDMRGEPVSLHRGDRLERRGGFLGLGGRVICAARSLVGKQHFARDDDGRGLERGDLTYALAYAPRRRMSDLHGRPARQRFSDEELKTLCTRWEKYKKSDEFWLFNDDFFDEEIDVLKEIAASVNVEISIETKAEAANV